MTVNGLVQIAVFFVILLLTTKPLGTYMAKVFAGERTFLSPILGPVERLCYRLCGVQPDVEQRWTQIGKQAQFLAQAQEAGFRPHVIRHIVPFGPAHGAENDGVGRVRLGHRLLSDTDIVGVVAAAADQALLNVETGDARFAQKHNDTLHLGHDFGTDAVTGEKKELVASHE